MIKMDNVKFGVMGIGGRKYRVRDVIIFPDGTVQRRKFDRWLASHHKYGKEDVEGLMIAGAETVVVGTGIFSGVKLSDEMREYSRNGNCKLVDLPSREAMQKFNDQVDSGNRIGALIHMLC